MAVASVMVQFWVVVLAVSVPQVAVVEGVGALLPSLLLTESPVYVAPRPMSIQPFLCLEEDLVSSSPFLLQRQPEVPWGEKGMSKESV